MARRGWRYVSRLALGVLFAACTEAPASASRACDGGPCGAPAPATCVATGIADPASLTASFDYRPTRACAEIPPALLSPTTPGTYLPGVAEVGAVYCTGLRPGVAAVTFRARVRLVVPVRRTPADCLCTSPWRVEMYLATGEGEVFPLDGLNGQSGGDASCLDGPDRTLRTTVRVPESGALELHLHLATCERAGATRCLFLRGTSLTVSQDEED